MTTPQYVPKKPTIKTSIHVPSLPLSAVKRDAEDTNREVVWDVGRAPAVETHGAMNEFGQGVSFFFKDLSYEGKYILLSFVRAQFALTVISKCELILV